jgi:hypothetical protein
MKTALAAVAIVCLMAAARPAHAVPPRYDDYRAVLMAFVDANGLVDYAGLRAQRGDLDDFVLYLGQLDPATYGAWPEPDRIAFWINAYNALTLRAIIDHYPIDPAQPNGSYPKNSIRQIPGVWDQARVNVMGESITLQYIETKHLGRDFHEPRVHMALVCAAMSCPRLRNEPYEGAKLEAQLADQTRAFISDPRHFRIDRARGTVRASEIFRWYAEDFAPAGTPKDRAALERSALITAAAPYLSDADRAFLKDARIEYAPYDWTLNEQPR